MSSRRPKVRVKAALDASIMEAFPAPPEFLTTFDHQVVDTSGPAWEWRSRPNAGTLYRFDFGRLEREGRVTPETLHVVRWWIGRVLQTRKGASAMRNISAIISFTTWRNKKAVKEKRAPDPLDFTRLEASELIAYHEALLASGRHTRSMRFMELRNMLRRVVVRAPTLHVDGLLEGLNAVRVKRARQGHAVRTRDPRKGALSRGELYALRKAIDDGVGTEFQRTLVLTCLETGLYPESLSDLWASEITSEREESLDRATGRMRQTEQWVLNRPRVKKRKRHRETRPLYVTPALGAALAARAKRDEYLFPELREGSDPIRRAARALTSFAQAAGLVNERTGEPLSLSARRFRYSLGTGLADDGQEAAVIAHALDHGHEKEAMPYIEVSRETVDRVNTQLAPLADSLIKRFRGELGDRQKTTGRALPVVPSEGPSLTSDRRLTGIGGCGAGRLCQLAWPLSCYGCRAFVAWEDADHAGVLSALLDLRAHHIEGGDTRVVSQLDDVILAVREVIEEVDRRRAGAPPEVTT